MTKSGKKTYAHAGRITVGAKVVPKELKMAAKASLTSAPGIAKRFWFVGCPKTVVSPGRNQIYGVEVELEFEMKRLIIAKGAGLRLYHKNAVIPIPGEMFEPASIVGWQHDLWEVHPGTRFSVGQKVGPFEIENVTNASIEMTWGVYGVVRYEVGDI